MGFGQEECDFREFTEVTSLSEYKITGAFAGWHHSLFITSEGKVLACGCNSCGQLLLSSGPSSSGKFSQFQNDYREIFTPIETSVTSGASFCIAGSNSSIVFCGFVPPNTPNRVLRNTQDASSQPPQKAIMPPVDLSPKESTFDNQIESKKTESSLIPNSVKATNQEEAPSHTNLSTSESEAQKSHFKINDLEQQISDTNKNVSKLINSIEKKKTRIEILDQDSFHPIKELGSGLLGSSHLVSITDSIHSIGVLKVLNKNDPVIIQNVMRDLVQLNRFNHPNINKTYGIFLGNENIPPSILSHRCSQTIDDLVENKLISKTDSVCIIYQIASGMKHAHSLNIIHRNLKPSNVFVSSDQTVKICNFGIAKMMPQKEQLSLISGDDTKLFFFIAPEMMNDEPITEKVDVFSFGSLLYFILNNGEIPKMTVFDYIEGKTSDIPSSLTKSAKEMIEICMNRDPNVRPDFNTICENIFKHMFDFAEFTANEKQELKERMIKIKEISF